MDEACSALTLQAEPARASVAKQFRMTLFESDTAALQQVREGYTFGYGVILDTPNGPPWQPTLIAVRLIDETR